MLPAERWLGRRWPVTKSHEIWTRKLGIDPATKEAKALSGYSMRRFLLQQIDFPKDTAIGIVELNDPVLN